MFSTQELESLCIVSSERGLQHTVLSKVKLSANMSRINTKWQGGTVSCAYFPQSKNGWVNTVASLVTGRTIRGNAVITGTTPEAIAAFQNRPKTWADLAKQLPKTMELDDIARTRLAQEQADRNTAWREYFQRKADRRRFINRDTADINLSTGEVVGEMTEAEQQAADDADAAFAEWNVEEELLEQAE